MWILHLERFIGYAVHFLHLNLSSWIFFFLYIHIFKGLMLGSFVHIKVVWVVGWLILVLTIIIAFIGYVLPWGQISLWGATVISNLLTTIPVLGELLVYWIWGGFFVSLYTIKLFFTLHFSLPILLLIFIIQHILLLHYNGSSNPLGGTSMLMKDEFTPSFILKDLINLPYLGFIIFIILLMPYAFRDCENFILANPLVSPIHIQPEWYFLLYYAILRAIPNKVGGVICFVISLVAITLLVLINTNHSFYTFKIWLWMCSTYLSNFILLTWLGGCPVEYPYLELSQVAAVILLLWYFTNNYILYKLF